MNHRQASLHWEEVLKLGFKGVIRICQKEKQRERQEDVKASNGLWGQDAALGVEAARDL